MPGSGKQLASDLCFSPPQELYYEDRHYHESCFRCFRCDRSLADEPFTCQGQELLCNGCYCQEFSSQCVACQQVVMPGAVMMMPLAPDPAAPGLSGAHPPSICPQVLGNWSTTGRPGTSTAFSAAIASSPLVLVPSSQSRTSITAYPATRANLHHAAPAARRLDLDQGRGGEGDAAGRSILGQGGPSQPMR